MNTQASSDTGLQTRSKLDAFFAIPAAAITLAILCNILWGCAFPFIKMSYRLFEITSTDTATIMCFAGIRFILGGLMVYLFGSLVRRKLMPLPTKLAVIGECCGIGLWQTTLQYFFYYTAVANLTGSLGGILNSTQSFLGVIVAHFLYGTADRLTSRKSLGCILGFVGVLVATLGIQGGGNAWGVSAMLAASAVFALAGPWNKRITRTTDSFVVCTINLFVGGLALFLIGTLMGGHLDFSVPGAAAGLPVLLFLALLSAACYVLWALLMKNNPVSRISVFCLCIPVVNTILSAIMNGEPLFDWRYIVALALVAAGIVLVFKPGKKQAGAAL